MILFKSSSDLQTFLTNERRKNKKIGYIPTMGALHHGHLSLIRRSQEETQTSVCSIFVNPTQFNELNDLEKYPRVPAKDIELLEKVGCDVLFMPAIEEIYPEGIGHVAKSNIDLQGLDQRLEGAFRPGHFQGVLQVVERLLNIVGPGKLFMGQKDFQQFLIIREMIRLLHLPVEIVACPIVREKNGLAMSSRNLRMDSDEKAIASQIFKGLKKAKKAWQAGAGIELIRDQYLQRLEKVGIRPEYFEIVDYHLLQPIGQPEPGKQVIACVATWVGSVRLIDNLQLQ